MNNKDIVDKNKSGINGPVNNASGIKHKSMLIKFVNGFSEINL